MATQVRAKSGERYWELVRRFPLRPIRSDADLKRAIAVVDALIDQDKRSRDEEDYLQVLADLVERYESVNEPELDTSPVDILRDLIEASGHTQAELADELGIARSTITEILKGKRGFSQRVILLLAERFKVDPSLFLIPARSR